MTTQESSGLHSLAALHEYERRQTELQAEAARRRAEAEQRARLEAERATLRAERERQQRARVAESAAELARNEQLAKLEAALAEEGARAERALREHSALQLELAAERGARRTAELAAAAQLLRQRWLTLISFALCVASWLGTAAAYFGSLRPAEERAQLAQRSALDERRARTEAETSAARLARRNELLAERANSLELALKNAPEVVSVPAPAPATKYGARRPQTVKPSQPPCRDDGDPLNPCLKTH